MSNVAIEFIVHGASDVVRLDNVVEN